VGPLCGHRRHEPPFTALAPTAAALAIAKYIAADVEAGRWFPLAPLGLLLILVPF
jgi:hypothetical protein